MQIVFSNKTKIQELRTESSHSKGCLTQKNQEGNIKHLKISEFKLHCDQDTA